MTDLAITKQENFKYDICLSFAGEDRKIVDSIATDLRELGIRVFYDLYEEADLWGKDLYTHLDYVYQRAAKYCILFISEHYASKMWTNHERRSAQARAIQAHKEYILPVRLDDTEIPGIPVTIGFIDLRQKSPDHLVQIIKQKIEIKERQNFFPPDPDKLIHYLTNPDGANFEAVLYQARHFWDVLQRMEPHERTVIYQIFLNGCPAELPENVHISLDYLRRITKHPEAELKEVLGALKSLGFFCSLREDDENPEFFGKSNMLVLEWHCFLINAPDNATDVANAIIQGAIDGYCGFHAMKALENLNFGQLSTVTTVEDEDLDEE